MVPTLLANWGITCTKDVGEIVFHLIEEGIFSKSEDDRIEDFENVYDFHTAFVAPFLPGGFTPMSASSYGKGWIPEVGNAFTAAVPFTLLLAVPFTGWNPHESVQILPVVCRIDS